MRVNFAVARTISRESFSRCYVSANVQVLGRSATARKPGLASAAAPPLAPSPPPHPRTTPHASASDESTESDAAPAPPEKRITQEDITAAYRDAALYLRNIGLTNASEAARVLDMSMNPSSMYFVKTGRKQVGNVHARLLTVESDIDPVVAFLQTDLGLTDEEICDVLKTHPPILCYAVETHLRPVTEYLQQEVGIPNVGQLVVARPSILALQVDGGLRRILGWLEANEYSMDDIVKYLSTSI